MRDNYRQFNVTDPFGREWSVEFRWLQNAISIRHADAVDLKYYVTENDERRELVVALPHPSLVRLAEEGGREITDAWCLRLGRLHVEHMISTWEDMDKTLVTVPSPDLAAYNATLEKASEEARLVAKRTH